MLYLPQVIRVRGCAGMALNNAATGLSELLSEPSTAKVPPESVRSGTGTLNGKA